MLGVERIVSVSAVGSLCEEYAPGDFVLPDQLVDRTTKRQQSFFGEGLVAHVSLAQPIDQQMASMVLTVGKALGLKIHQGGSYVTIEGPQFSTQAESELFRSWGCQLVGMTNGSEAKLAREAGMEFCTIAMVTDLIVGIRITTTWMFLKWSWWQKEMPPRWVDCWKKYCRSSQRWG